MPAKSVGPIPPPPLVYLAFIGCAWALARWAPLDLPPHELVAYAGWTAIALGVLLMLWAAWEMLRHRTTINPYGRPSSLLQTGPFGFSRNPIYLADTLIYCMQRAVIVHEEHLLTRLFDDEYRTYRRRVRRWL